ncbi:AAA family ATPase [Paenibacillus hamazuiensis]|uniref:AAA family ATPase n=1 Tax=Paenibacillus hamazuiensis TaxID=2936508 RepID=UPI002010216E|nr:AAA family ATPase [Paenibacillus hamazuiensis]
MRKLVFFIGPAGAGKTTLAKALAARRRAAFFDMDTLLRPAAEAIMTLSGLDPNDRDSPVYKTRCRDLGYRITMDAALENVELGIDAIVVGPFTKETEDPAWLAGELARIGASADDVDVRAVFVYLPDMELYRERLRKRASPLDVWKLDNWNEFSRSLALRQIRWDLPPSSIVYFDNSGPFAEEKLAELERLVYGGGPAES